ncbi:hypothetical protein Tco_0839410 [Tanacetum coccineum]|uniref:Tf2-1-like SH3-like domain-containing protein n=1 Tax=Tanacetum coccineum TaxID=301880 RepID=A0ABQ5AUI3_9ASTR
MGFDYEVVYKKGSENEAVDALSRVENDSELLQLFVSTVSTKLMQKVKDNWVEDYTLNSILISLQTGLPTKKHYTLVNDQLLRKDKIVVGIYKDLIEGKIGEVAYKLLLPAQAQVHNVFHMSQLKKFRGEVTYDMQVTALPMCDVQGRIEVHDVSLCVGLVYKCNDCLIVVDISFLDLGGTSS